MNSTELIKLPIGFMDSGLGGLSVLKEAVSILPCEDFIYYGDSANAPYGTKSTQEIQTLTFGVVEKLMRQGIKGLVVACNTATAAAVRLLREKYPEMPIVGIEPAIKPACEASRGGEILVLATPMTLRQEKFQSLLKKYGSASRVRAVPCEGLMEFVENCELSGAVLDAYFKEHIQPYITNETETIVLGCTHYPFLRPHLREYLKNKDINIIDGSRGTAAELRRRLYAAGLLRTDDGHTGHITVENSAGDEMIRRSYRMLTLPTE